MAVPSPFGELKYPSQIREGCFVPILDDSDFRAAARRGGSVVLLFGLYYTHHRLLRAALGHPWTSGLLPGTEVPNVLVADAKTGHGRSTAEISAEFQSLIFVSASCEVCRNLLQPVLDSPVMRTAAVYCDGDRQDCEAWLTRSGVTPLFIRRDEDAVDAFELVSLPSLVRIEDGKVQASVYPVTSADLVDTLERWAN